LQDNEHSLPERDRLVPTSVRIICAQNGRLVVAGSISDRYKVSLGNRMLFLTIVGKDGPGLTSGDLTIPCSGLESLGFHWWRLTKINSWVYYICILSPRQLYLLFDEFLFKTSRRVATRFWATVGVPWVVHPVQEPNSVNLVILVARLQWYLIASSWIADSSEQNRKLNSPHTVYIASELQLEPFLSQSITTYPNPSRYSLTKPVFWSLSFNSPKVAQPAPLSRQGRKRRLLWERCRWLDWRMLSEFPAIWFGETAAPACWRLN
jgi:hypothetical protein